MASYISLDDVVGNDPLGVDLHIVDSAAEQWGLGGIGTTADTHIEHRVAAYGPKLLGGDIDQNPSLLLFRMLDLPTAAFHIDSKLPSFIGVISGQQSLLQSMVHVV